MIDVVTLSPTESAPHRDAVLAYQGVPGDGRIPDPVNSLCDESLWLLADFASPMCAISPISKADFANVHRGEGLNDSNTPVGSIYERSDHLALFAATIGPRISEEIERLFACDDFALASMLDAAASASMDRITSLIETHYLSAIRSNEDASSDLAVLGYSPGYCGWHVSAQRKLFEHLPGDRIGVTLTDECLMQPIKSVSGVLIAGAKTIHAFRNDYPFCKRCEYENCRARLRSLYAR